MVLLAGFLMRQSVSHENFRLFVGVGILGGFTTFSSFSLDVATMIERGDWGVALGYVLVSVIGSVLAPFGWRRRYDGWFRAAARTGTPARHRGPASPATAKESLGPARPGFP